MVKDEADFIEYSLSWMAQQVDHILIADNLSTDNTLEILHDVASTYKNINIVIDEEVGYYQSSKMNKWIRYAAELDPYISWIVPFDADEMWFSRTSTISDTLLNCPFNVVECQAWHMVSKDEVTSSNPLQTMVWRRSEPEPFVSVAFKYDPAASLKMGNHDVWIPEKNLAYNLLEIKHYQYRSYEHFRRKTINGKKAYDATDFEDFVGAHWREFGAMSDEELREVWNSWCLEENLVYDPW